jgi:hypothetical protein
MQVGENLLDDHQCLNAGNHFDVVATFTARFDWGRRHAVCNGRPRGVRHSRCRNAPAGSRAQDGRTLSSLRIPAGPTQAIPCPGGGQLDHESGVVLL